MKKHLRKSSFTLIELLIVVAIIGILAAIAVPNFLNAQVRAKVSRTLADFRSIATALESYYVDNQDYPRDFNDIPAGYAPNFPNNIVYSQSVNTRMITLTSPVNYMSSIPRDPFTKSVSWYSFFGGETAAEKYPLSIASYMYCSYQGDPAPPIGNKRWKGDAWGLGTIGPDGDYDSGFNIESGFYAATNGTLSQGDIMFFSFLKIIQ
ncbi:MAG TPA: prepilin-type N-terminal cleavage/methylation domain-containing protein [bacterium]|nr:prepilin-type N-terminal cleavage/methylation domain-containing protein [bacterium]HQO36276.1 prepilin-type N-terminal cleavage/methylation domain-containing protein [bacterium]